MQPYSIAHEMMCFDIPAAKMNDIVAWILLADKTYMRREIERRGFATVIGLNGNRGFNRITEIPPVAGTAVPYYGMTGGAYRFSFTINANGTRLLVEHQLGKSLGLPPYDVILEKQAKFKSHAEPTSYWYYNRLENLIEKRSLNYSMFIDGEIYVNMLATGWQRESAREYIYQFIPTTVGCIICLHHLVSGQIHNLTVNIDW